MRKPIEYNAKAHARNVRAHSLAYFLSLTPADDSDADGAGVIVAALLCFALAAFLFALALL